MTTEDILKKRSIPRNNPHNLPGKIVNGYKIPCVNLISSIPFSVKKEN